jgi:hypothetical protein
MGDVMEAAEPAEVTNTETAVVPYPVEAAMEAVSALRRSILFPDIPKNAHCHNGLWPLPGLE